MSTPGSGRSPEELRELLAAYSLDAVDDVEGRAVERFVADDEDAARELASFRATAAELGAVHALEPPAGLRARILAEVAATEQEHRVETGPAVSQWPRGRQLGREESGRQGQRHDGGRTSGRSSGSGRRRITPAALRLAVAAAVVAAVAVPSVIAVQERERAVQAEQQAELMTDLLAEPGAQVLRGDVTGGGEAVAVLTDRRALLVVEGLPDLATGTVYQLWAMRDGVPVPAGLLPEPRAGSVSALASDYRAGDGLAVSVEPAGGSAQPTTTPLVVLLPG